MDKVTITPEEEIALFPFRKEEVDRLNDPAHYAKVGNTSSYVQLRTPFDRDNLRTLLDKLNISRTKLGKVLLFGGYTGQYGEALRDLGYEVIFTDILPEWVDQAKTRGFESYQAKAEDIPIELQKGLDFYTTFECYGPLCNGNPLKIVMESVGNTTQGLVFVENEQELSKYNHHSLLIASLKKIGTVYSIEIAEESSSPLHGVRVHADKEGRRILSEDLVIMRLTNFLIKKGKQEWINPYSMSRLLEKDRPEFTEDRIKSGIERILQASK
jgi:hypothetical protein